ELEQLQQHDIPAGRQVLRDHHCNLHRVADYCESNYLQASDKRKALEETMALSTQSLASVTYQVSSLATAFLRLLDLQTAEVRKVEADVTCVAQRVDMHKEKVSRREIGSLTVSKKFPSYQKIVPPPSPPCLEPYYRKPLNFSVLDDIGHGIKDHSTQLSRTGTLARKGIKSATQAAGTLGRSTRAPEPIQPPVVPESKLFTASSTSSLISVRYRRCPGGQEGLGVGGVWSSPPPVATIPPPPPLPGDLPPPPLGDLAVPPLDLPLPTTMALRVQLRPGIGRDWDGERCRGLLTSSPPTLPGGGLSPLPPLAVVSLYPYTRQKDNELSFQPGTLLFVTRRYSDGWCEGVMGEEVGFFPGNYVEPF
ncbi:ABI3 protein, partial [Pandion haliaetus]|nr:ABI3 protein [Pandion haliaetus]